MATFLVERYWPGVTAVAAQAVTASLGGPDMLVVETIVTGPDEVCFWYVEAASEHEITGAFESAGVPIDRISPATALPERRMAISRPALDIGAAPRSSVAGMASIPETGFLVIADLTGYTAYLTGSEIEHAPAIAGDLLETIVGRLEPPFRLAKFEGDAAFLFVEDGRSDGSLLLDAIEAAYVAFRRRLRSIDQATSCDCNSCRLAPRLDLKLFVHHGAFVRGRIAGRDELAGSDVILVHRLLKAATAGAARGDGFALFTADAVKALGLEPGALGFSSGELSIEHLGRVPTFTLDLEARWQAETEVRRIDPAAADVILDVATTIAADPSVVWAHLTSPALRMLWEGPLVMEDLAAGGRRGVGTTSQCVTSRLATLEEVVDWQPHERVAWRLAVPDLGPIEAVTDLDAVPGGTRLRLRWAQHGESPAAADRDRADPRRQGGRLRAPGDGHRRIGACHGPQSDGSVARPWRSGAARDARPGPSSAGFHREIVTAGRPADLGRILAGRSS